jgi:hypothetical protein
LPPVAIFDNYWAPTLAFAFSLGRRGVPLHFYGAGAGRWSRYCSRRAPCPPIEDAGQFLPWLLQRVRRGEIARIAPTTDLVAYYVSVLREEFPPDVRRSIAPLGEIETALIKSRFSAACVAGGQSVPTTYAPEDLPSALQAAHELGYPLVMKPKAHIVVGAAERGCVVCDESDLRASFGPYPVAPGQSQLAARYPELLWPLLQRYLPAARRRVYSVTGFKDPDRGIVTSLLSYKREQWPPDVGTSTVQVGAQDDLILESGIRTVDRLLSRGIFELELVVDHQQPLAIDLNPRAFGFMNLDIALGQDLPWLWLSSTLEAVEPQKSVSSPVALEARHVLLHFLRQLADGRGRRSGSTDIERRDPARPRGRISMLGHRSDPVPMLIAHARLLRHPRSLLRTHFANAQSERVQRAVRLQPSKD